MIFVCLVCVFVHSRFIENPPIDLETTNPSFLRQLCHSLPVKPLPICFAHKCYNTHVASANSQVDIRKDR
jgi:hypothetical protein